MKKPEILFLIVSIFLLFGCTNHENETRLQIDEKVKLQDTSEVQKEVRELEPPIDITRLSEIKYLDWNSGVINSKKEYCYHSKNSHYGFYSLIDKRKINTNSIDEIIVGRIVINRKKSKSIWTEKDTTQIIQHIELKSDILTLWQVLKVGLSKHDLLNIIGDNFHYQKGTIIYTEMKGYNCSFSIKSDSISEITIDKRCNR